MTTASKRLVLEDTPEEKKAKDEAAAKLLKDQLTASLTKPAATVTGAELALVAAVDKATSPAATAADVVAVKAAQEQLEVAKDAAMEGQPAAAAAVAKVARADLQVANAQVDVAQAESEAADARAKLASEKLVADKLKAEALKTLAPPAGRRPKLSLVSVIKGKQVMPARIFAYGVEGIGKSTLGSNAPAPIFIGAENGTSQLNTSRFPTPDTLTDVYDALALLTHEKHDYRTLVVDTADWLEALVWNHICLRDSKAGIEDYGYGKGFNVAIDEWRVFVGALERLRTATKMAVVLLGHSLVKVFHNPEGEDFDRYELKMNQKAGGLLKEWCDAVLFCNFETFAKKAVRDEKNKMALAKGVSSGTRLIYTERTAAWDAKNRYSLPFSMPLSWSALEDGMNAVIDPAALLEAINQKLPELAELQRSQVVAAIGRAGKDGDKLQVLHNWINARLAEARKER